MGAAKAQLKVAAPLVTARTTNGRVVYLFKGDVVTEDIDQESIDHLESLGFLTEDSPAADADQKPAGNASQADWTKYAKAQGKTDEDLDGLGRDEIRALFP